MNLTKEKYIQDLLIQADLYRLVSLGLEVMDWENQYIFFENLEEFLSIDFDNILVIDKNFYQLIIDLLRELMIFKNQPLEGEYHRLFDLQGGLSNSEAGYVKIEKGNILNDITSFYKALDFPYIVEKVGSPDTITKETGFISFMFLKEFALLQDDSLSEMEKEEKKEILKEIRFKFLNDHYLTWVPEFINTLFETTEHRFYINLGKILQLLIEKVH